MHKTEDTIDVPVCDSCATGIENSDWTHLDFYVDSATEEEWEDNHGATLASAELVISVDTDNVMDDTGYFDCWVCGSTDCGYANRGTILDS